MQHLSRNASKGSIIENLAVGHIARLGRED